MASNRSLSLRGMGLGVAVNDIEAGWSHTDESWSLGRWKMDRLNEERREDCPPARITNGVELSGGSSIKKNIKLVDKIWRKKTIIYLAGVPYVRANCHLVSLIRVCCHGRAHSEQSKTNHLLRLINKKN